MIYQDDGGDDGDDDNQDDDCDDGLASNLIPPSQATCCTVANQCCPSQACCNSASDQVYTGCLKKNALSELCCSSQSSSLHSYLASKYSDSSSHDMNGGLEAEGLGGAAQFWKCVFLGHPVWWFNHNMYNLWCGTSMHYAAIVAIREWKNVKSKWLDFTHCSTKYFFIVFY